MKLTVLGSGSPEAYARRASSGFLLEVGGDRVLFDCGGGVFDNLLRAGLLPSDITHLVFSHLHSDHMMDYARLVHAAWDEGGAPLKVFGPAPLARITEGYFGREGVLAHDLIARTELKGSQEVWLARGGTLPRHWPAPEVTEITAGAVIEGDGWRITAATATHAQPYLDCMGFALEAGGKKFVYSGDSGITPGIEALAQNADLLVHWCYRLEGVSMSAAMEAVTPTPAEIGAMATRAGVKRLLLSHFRVYMDARLEQAKATLAAHFDGPCGVVEDLDVFEI